jgi:hypothetical protein
MRTALASKGKLEQKRKAESSKKIPRLSDQEFSFFNTAYNPQPLPPLWSRFTDAGQQPPQLSAGMDRNCGLLFGLSLVLRKRHPFADDFSPRLVFGLHAQDPLL